MGATESMLRYVPSIDTKSRTAAWDHTPPRSYRTKHATMRPGCVRDDGRDYCDRIARTLVLSAYHAAGEECPPSGDDDARHLHMTSMYDALYRMLPEDSKYELVKVPSNSRAVAQCLSAGHLLCVALPVTEDVLDGDFHCPRPGTTPFALVPVIVKGYAMTSSVYTVDVPLGIYRESIKVGGKHLFDTRACDYYTVVPPQSELETPMFIP